MSSNMKPPISKDISPPMWIKWDPPVTTIRWRDGTVTSVKCVAGTPYDKHAAFCAAFTKRLLGGNRAIMKIVEPKSSRDEFPWIGGMVWIPFDLEEKYKEIHGAASTLPSDILKYKGKVAKIIGKATPTPGLGYPKVKVWVLLDITGDSILWNFDLLWAVDQVHPQDLEPEVILGVPRKKEEPHRRKVRFV